jgi:hypothetical protein
VFRGGLQFFYGRGHNQGMPAQKPTRILPEFNLEPVDPVDFNEVRLAFSCESCSHFDSANARCTLGLSASNHLRQRQLDAYRVGGRMAICRFLEID